MKKKIVGIALTAVMALGGMSAFASEDAPAQQNTQARAEQGAKRGQGKMARLGGQCTGENAGENRASRLESIVKALESAGKSDIAAKLQAEEFGTVREAIESLTEEENLAVREVMRELKLNGNGNASGNGMAKRDGSMGLCEQ